MLCDECNEKPATFFLTQIIHGEMTTRNLCQTCAAPILNQLPPARWTAYPPTPGFDEILEHPADCPSEVTIDDPVTIKDLAAALRVEPYHVIAVLLQRNIFKGPNDALDFATASLVCVHYGVTPRKGTT
jgi:Translation initiation factor IF-2, N-terminal region